MKVKELIEKLSELDQERNIWVESDEFFATIPWVGTLDEQDIEDYVGESFGMNIGDYILK